MNLSANAKIIISNECFTFIQFHRSSSLREIGKGFAATRQSPFLVARGSWLVARGSWFVARRGSPEGLRC